MNRLSLVAMVLAGVVFAGNAWAASDENDDQVLITEEQKQQYSQRMEDKLSEWKARVERATERGAEKAGEVGEAGKQELEQAWRDVQSDWAELQNASGKAWEKGKRELDESMEALEKKWEELSS
jgi:hypothetical protein